LNFLTAALQDIILPCCFISIAYKIFGDDEWNLRNTYKLIIFWIIFKFPINHIFEWILQRIYSKLDIQQELKDDVPSAKALIVNGILEALIYPFFFCNILLQLFERNGRG